MFYFFLHHKAASMWTQSVFSEVCRVAGWTFDVFWESSTCGDSLPDFVEAHPSLDVLFVHNPKPEQVMQLGRVTGVRITRDPRDVIASAYRSHRDSHWFPEESDDWHHQQALREADPEEGLRLELDHSSRYLPVLSGWLDHVHQPDVIDLRFEDLAQNPYQTALTIMETSGRLCGERSGRHFIRTSLQAVLNRMIVKVGLRWPMRAVPGGQVLAALHRHRYQRNDHHRGGEQGKWKRAFSPDNLAYYHHLYGNLAERMGYESSSSTTRKQSSPPV